VLENGVVGGGIFFLDAVAPSGRDTRGGDGRVREEGGESNMKPKSIGAGTDGGPTQPRTSRDFFCSRVSCQLNGMGG
jgi:hypothetical protein